MLAMHLRPIEFLQLRAVEVLEGEVDHEQDHLLVLVHRDHLRRVGGSAGSAGRAVSAVAAREEQVWRSWCGEREGWALPRAAVGWLG